MEHTGAQRLIERILEQGVQVVVGIPGGSILPLYDALHGSSLRHVLARHEQGAAFIAQGMARSTGVPGVCLATSGPGATNLLTALADAERDSVPLVAITAQVARDRIGTRAFQEADIAAMAAPCVKQVFQPASADELDRTVPLAFEAAGSERPGPVLIDIPKDVFLERCSGPAVPARIGPPTPGPSPDRLELERARSLLEASRRPMLLAGAGACRGRAPGILAELCSRTGTPLASTLMGLGALPTGHPSFMGMAGMHGHPGANHALERADLLVVVGARLDERLVGDRDRFAHRAKIVRIDVDGTQARRHRCDALLHARADDALDALFVPGRGADIRAWLEEIESLRERHPLARQEAHGIVAAVAEAAGRDAIFSTDVGQHQMWAAQSCPVHEPCRFLTSGGFGTMGFGLPAAIGASIANPGRPTVCFTGDGSLLMNIQELSTLAELGLPVKVCVFDNAGLGLVRQQQSLFFGGRLSGCEHASRPDFAAVAAAFGIPSAKIGPGEWMDGKWLHLVRGPGPALVVFETAPERMVSPHVRPGRPNQEMLYPPVAG